jgi:hypothetical protein
MEEVLRAADYQFIDLMEISQLPIQARSNIYSWHG